VTSKKREFVDYNWQRQVMDDILRYHAVLYTRMPVLKTGNFRFT